MDFTEILRGACSLSKFVKYIHSCPDRKNIRLSIVDAGSKSVSCFNWLLNILSQNREKSPKVLIYCRSQKLVSWLFGQFRSKLGLGIYKNQEEHYDNFLVGMFHADTSTYNKEKYLASLTSVDDSMLPRVVIATSTIGCGINAKKLKYVCHFGPAFSLVDYCQQIGRAGRNGESDCHAILYTYKGCDKDINRKMKDYTKLETCLRTALFSPFNENSSPIVSLTPPYSCCSVCHRSSNHPNNHDFEKECEFGTAQVIEPVRNATMEDKSAIEALLLEYHHNYFQNDPHINLPSSSMTGLTRPVITDILENINYVTCPDYLMDHMTIVDEHVAIKIYSIISEYFVSCPEKEPETDKNSDSKEEKCVFSDFENLSDIDIDFELEH